MRTNIVLALLLVGFSAVACKPSEPQGVYVGKAQPCEMACRSLKAHSECGEADCRLIPFRSFSQGQMKEGAVLTSAASNAMSIAWSEGDLSYSFPSENELVISGGRVRSRHLNFELTGDSMVVAKTIIWAPAPARLADLVK